MNKYTDKYFPMILRYIKIIYTYIYIYNTISARKTHVFASVCSQVMKGRGGVGGHVNVPCTSSATCCYAAQMSGSVASLYM